MMDAPWVVQMLGKLELPGDAFIRDSFEMAGSCPLQHHLTSEAPC